MKRYHIFLIVILFSAITVIGCDMLNPPKKTAKTTNKTNAVATLTPVQAAEAPAVAEAIGPLPVGVLAKVGAWTITKDEFSERIKNVKTMVKDFDDKDTAAKNMLLNELVRQQLLVQQARVEKLQETQEFQAAVKDFENTILVQEIVAKLTKGIEAAEDDAKKYYDENPDEFKKPLEKQIREIVLTTQTEANDVLVQVLQGKDFAQAAKEKSKSASKDNGGDLGFKLEASFPAMAVAVSTLKKGGISSVFEGPDGFYIVKVEDIRGGETVDYAEVKTDLMKFLTLRKQQQVLKDKLDQISKQIKVQVNEDLLKAGTGE